MRPHHDTKRAKETRARIKTARADLAGLVETNGQRYLAMRRLLGLPDPPDWGHRMLRYHLGTAYLLKAAEQPGFTVQDVPALLRDMLTHPIYGHPATDGNLRAIITTYQEEPCLD